MYACRCHACLYRSTSSSYRPSAYTSSPVADSDSLGREIVYRLLCTLGYALDLRRRGFDSQGMTHFERSSHAAFAIARSSLRNWLSNGSP